ncbi:MAG: hypothetical protein PUC44_07365 [Eubacteriales bacterium]|nr:hypothetical protein [Eubacteriales bacterium]
MQRTYDEKWKEKCLLRIQEAEKEYPLEKLKDLALSIPPSENPYQMAETLLTPGLTLIGRIKAASESGEDVLDSSDDWDTAGIDAFLADTEEDIYTGRSKVLSELCESVSVPVIRKDGIVSPYAVYQSKVFGLSAVLLPAGLLSDAELSNLLLLSDMLEITALAEIQSEEDLKKSLQDGASAVWISPAGEKPKEEKIESCLALMELLPSDVIAAADLEISCPDEAMLLEDAGLHGVTLFRDPETRNLRKFVKSFRNAAKKQTPVSSGNPFSPDYF